MTKVRQLILLSVSQGGAGWLLGWLVGLFSMLLLLLLFLSLPRYMSPNAKENEGIRLDGVIIY